MQQRRPSQTTVVSPSHWGSKKKWSMHQAHRATRPLWMPGVFQLRPSGTSISGGLPRFYPLFTWWSRRMKRHGRIINTFSISECYQRTATAIYFFNWHYSWHYIQITLPGWKSLSFMVYIFHANVATLKIPCNYDYLIIISNFKSQITDGVCLLSLHFCYFSFSSWGTEGHSFWPSLEKSSRLS